MKEKTKPTKRSPDETAQLAAEIAELREKGYSCAEIGKMYGHDPSYIATIIKRYCPDLLRRYSSSKTGEKVGRYKAMVLAGKSTKEMADILGVGVNTVRQFLYYHHAEIYGSEKNEILGKVSRKRGKATDERYMDDGEMARSYKAAANKRSQLLVLAQLNGMAVSDVRDILVKQGVMA